MIPAIGMLMIKGPMERFLQALKCQEMEDRLEEEIFLLMRAFSSP